MKFDSRFGPRLTSKSFFWQRGLTGKDRASGSGSASAGKDATGAGSAMAATLIERAWIWIHETFPERQIYIRSDGRVQFFTFGPSLQATLCGPTLIFLGWRELVTVNGIFKDRILEAQGHRYKQMQAAYESRVADLQVSYDELNGALVAAEDRFKSTADALENKQNTIPDLINRESAAQSAAGRTVAAAPPPQFKLDL